jgi:hypothetical protein
MTMGHEYCGIVEEVGSAVKTIKRGQFVVGSFCLSDNTCPHCKFGFQSSCEQREFMSGAQAPLARVHLADGPLVAVPGMPSADLIPSLLAASDVLGTGWDAADAARVRPGSTVVVVGDGAVGLMGVLASKQMGAERIIAMSRHKKRGELAQDFGATDKRLVLRHAGGLTGSDHSLKGPRPDGLGLSPRDERAVPTSGFQGLPHSMRAQLYHP